MELAHAFGSGNTSQTGAPAQKFKMFIDMECVLEAAGGKVYLPSGLLDKRAFAKHTGWLDGWCVYINFQSWAQQWGRQAKKKLDTGRTAHSTHYTHYNYMPSGQLQNIKCITDWLTREIWNKYKIASRLARGYKFLISVLCISPELPLVCLRLARSAVIWMSEFSLLLARNNMKFFFRHCSVCVCACMCHLLLDVFAICGGGGRRGQVETIAVRSLLPILAPTNELLMDSHLHPQVLKLFVNSADSVTQGLNLSNCCTF